MMRARLPFLAVAICLLVAAVAVAMPLASAELTRIFLAAVKIKNAPTKFIASRVPLRTEERSVDACQVLVVGRELSSPLPEPAPSIAREWVQKTGALLGMPRPFAGKITVCFSDQIKSGGETIGTTIRISTAHPLKNPNDFGILIHELVHLMQNYPPDSASPWLTEGIADWVRYFHFEPQRGERYFRTGDDATWGGANFSYRSGYLPAAAFLEYLRQHCAPNIIQELNASLADGSYSDQFFHRKGIPDLDKSWQEFTATWQRPEPSQTQNQ